jgi:N-acetylmuramic acid 6-phosphate etherase
MSEAITESINPATAAIDTLSSLEIVRLINQEDARVASAVQAELAHIARAVDIIVERLESGGRLFYFGAGTSGRLGVLDASELAPTYSTPPGLVQAFIAGGDGALRQAVEAAEDDAAGGRQAADEAGVGEGDVVVGITASGGAPWVLGAVEVAHQRGAATIAVVCNPDGALASQVDVAIAPVVGPEVIAGSSRMKAGSAQKMVLNMLSTAAMIRLGKVYGNMMVDMRASNQKLRRRALDIVQKITGASAQNAGQALQASGYEIKPALVMLLADVSLEEARRRLEQASGRVRAALGEQSSSTRDDP